MSPPQASADDGRGADGSALGHADEIEETVPAWQQLQESAARLLATVRASVPLRTVAFVLPPLLLPVLAFDLSFGGAFAVTVLLLWLAAAAGVVATMMFEGSDQLALRAIERRLDELPSPATGRPADDEALLAVGAQLDALNDRLDELTAATRTPAPQPAAQRRSPEEAVDHRPQEHWSTSEEVDQYVRTTMTSYQDATGAHPDGNDDHNTHLHW